MQTTNYIASIVMITTGIIIGCLIKVDKVDDSALLLVAPMIMVGLFIFAYSMSRRNNGNTR